MKASVDFIPGKRSSVDFASNGSPPRSLEKWPSLCSFNSNA